MNRKIFIRENIPRVTGNTTYGSEFSMTSNFSFFLATRHVVDVCAVVSDDEADLPSLEQLMATPRRVNGAERTPASADRSNTVIFTENADIALVIGSKSVTHHFMISRPKLANAAPKLEAALQAIEQDNASAPSLFRLPDDVTDLTAIRVVLQLSHHDFDQLPQAIGFETLFQLAIMADRYELTRLLRPFVRPWLAAFAPAEINTSRHEWVLISWTFGLKALFCAFVDNLINSSHLSVLGDLVTIESMYLPMKASITGRPHPLPTHTEN
jgi:hypothetical protein